MPRPAISSSGINRPRTQPAFGVPIARVRFTPYRMENGKPVRPAGERAPRPKCLSSSQKLRAAREAYERTMAEKAKLESERANHINAEPDTDDHKAIKTEPDCDDNTPIKAEPVDEKVQGVVRGFDGKVINEEPVDD